MPPVDRRIDRRGFLVLAGVTAAGVALAGCGGSASPAPPTEADVIRFTTVSAILAGVRPLPAAPAAGYLEGLEAAGLELSPMAFVDQAYGTTGAPEFMRDLVRSGATALPGAEACMRAIASAWWSGIVPTKGGGQRVVTFTDALVWRRVHTSSECLGALGSWSGPGEGTA